MQKNRFCLVLTLTIVYFVESSPVDVGTYDFDNLAADYIDGYENDEPNWGTIFLKLIGASTPKSDSVETNDNKKATVKTSGVKKNNQLTKGVHSKHSIGDVSKFFKTGAEHDHGVYDDASDFGKGEAVTAAAVVTKGNEVRNYARGNKTTGFHRVHHKDEYKSDQEFYEIDETKGTTKKGGAKAVGAIVNTGASYNRRRFNNNHHNGVYGKEGFLDNGFSDKQFNEYQDSEEISAAFDNEIDG